MNDVTVVLFYAKSNQKFLFKNLDTYKKLFLVINMWKYIIYT